MGASNVTFLGQPGHYGDGSTVGMLTSTPKEIPPPTRLAGGSGKTPKEPLYGFVPRRVNAKQVQGVLVRGKK